MALGGEFPPYLGCQSECHNPATVPPRLHAILGALLLAIWAPNLPGSLAILDPNFQAPCRAIWDPNLQAPSLATSAAKFPPHIRGSFASNYGSKTSRLSSHFGSKLPGTMPCQTVLGRFWPDNLVLVVDFGQKTLIWSILTKKTGFGQFRPEKPFWPFWAEKPHFGRFWLENPIMVNSNRKNWFGSILA